MQHQAATQRRPARHGSRFLRLGILASCLGAFACLTAALLLPAPGVQAAEVRRSIPYARNTKLAVPAAYQFRFSLWTAQGAGAGAEVWSEKTKGRKLVSRTVRHNLGSVNPFTAPSGYAPVDFAQQLFVQTEYRRAGQAAFTVLGGRTALTPAAYALWAASVADESVPAAGLSAAGSAEGQLLTSVGGKVLWQDPAGAGASTVNSVAAGAGVTVSPTTGDVTVGLDTAYTDARYLQTTGGALSGELEATVLESTAATGTPPLVVVSTTKVDNLNADLLDGLHATAFAAAAHAHDADYVNAAGDTMTGTLTINNNPTGGDVLLIRETDLNAWGAFNINLSQPDAAASLFVLNPGTKPEETVNLVVEGALGIGAVPAAGRLIDTSSGAYLAGGTWTNASDRDRKEAFVPVDAPAVLAKLAALPLTTWNYKSEDASVRHLGPMAQDFSAAFGLGGDERAITTVDAQGVAFAAIQALHAQVEAQREQIAVLAARLEEQRALVQRLLAAAGSPAPAALAAR